MTSPELEPVDTAERRHSAGTAAAGRMPVDLTAYDVILINSSGGKDSQTLLHHIATQAHQQAVADRVTVLHCALWHVEWPDTAELAQSQAEYYGLRYEQRRRDQGPLLDQVRRRGKWPSAAARYCTSDQKRGPARKLITQLVTELGPLGRPAQVLNCLGLRAVSPVQPAPAGAATVQSVGKEPRCA
ncbi:tRNA lysidine(34) synthetase [Actinocatenispora comari]|uniref:Uncharacterized protein n=1 Tax=Actinocatenispora comari TaxID=2807577 RepID=A0A8J4EHX0_9ACTN|nr:hypothetical protein [Actinocatenispora comari]GIL25477.1 hypothetical protein NUM_07320 [Actinocatenispora comari]